MTACSLTSISSNKKLSAVFWKDFWSGCKGEKAIRLLHLDSSHASLVLYRSPTIFHWYSKGTPLTLRFPTNPRGNQLVWMSCFKITDEVRTVARWWKENKMMTVSSLLLIFLRIHAGLKESFIWCFLDHASRHLRGEIVSEIHNLLCRKVGFIYVTR